MRKIQQILWIVPLVIIFMANVSWGQLLTEDFNFSGKLTDNSWTAHSGGGTNAISTSGVPGLTYTGFIGSGIGNAASMITSGEDDNKQFTSTSSGSIYFSFMVNVSASQTAGDYFIHLTQGNPTLNAFFAKVYIKKDNSSSKFAFGILKKATTAPSYTGYNYSIGTVYLVVMKYTFNTTSTTDDVVSLFVNPVINGSEPSATLTMTDATQTDATSLDYIALRQGTSTSAPTLVVDGIRVGTSWIDVVPYSATPTITLSSPSQVSAGNVDQGATNVILSNFQAAVTVANATLNSLAFTSEGTYSASDLTNFKLWYNGTNNTFGSATQIGSSIILTLGTGSHTFSSLSQTINNGSTGYFWITCDISSSATVGSAINAAANPTLTFVSGTPSGTIDVGGSKTIHAVTPNITLSSPNPAISVGNITQNTTNNVIY